MNTYAIRRPGGKAHREAWTYVGNSWEARAWARRPVCGLLGGSAATERVPLADVPPADLCKRCWPEGAK